ncbi:MAG: response regulator [Acidobacteria bacterium]|nr:response regulator [Acidobacteriota bacterium]
MLRRLIGENIELVTRLAPDLARVKADRNQLEQVMMNLLINARDAMPQGGRLILETGNTEWDEAYCLQHRGARPGSYAMLAVSDTGVGMDAETRARIFEPFFTTKEKGKGTGLGLATVYGIVKQYGGYIWVYSEPGQGSTFKIYLPQVEAVREAEALAEAAAGAPSGSETVLLVEDEEGVRKLSRQFLEQSGYTVLEASDPAAALWLAEQHPGRIDLLVTDVMMSQMGGREVAERLTQVRPEIKVLFVSGHTDDVVLRQGILDGGAAFLQKPFSRDALARKVREVLDTTPVH